MEIIFEIIFSLIFEGSYEAMKSKKVPLAVRIICGIIFFSVILSLITLLGFFSHLMWNDKQYLISAIFIIADLAILLAIIKEIKKIKELKDEKSN